MKKVSQRKPLPVPLDKTERAAIEKLAREWGCSNAAAIRRLIRDSLKAEQTRGDAD